MFSDSIKSALETEVVGQPRAIASLVQGVTRAASGLEPPEETLCAYLFMGPSGTGKTHIVQTLARILHGDPRRLIVADCSHSLRGDPWLAFITQLAPLFATPQGGAWSAPRECPLFPAQPRLPTWPVCDCPPLSIVLVEYLERGRPEIAKSLAVALETGRVALPDGRQGSLRHCILILTSGLCAREILDEGPRIGFAGTPEEEEQSEERRRLFKLCYAEAQKHYGTDLMARLDDVIVFHRLREEHLAEILSRLVVGLNHRLAGRGLRCELTPAAREFVLERGRRQLQTGSRELLRAHRRFVEFPLGDLTLSGGIPAGSLIVVDRKGEERNLHFTVTRDDRAPAPPAPGVFARAGAAPAREVEILWEEPDHAWTHSPDARARESSHRTAR
jgi:ATP-dependent Clp protease ATP-binding subunit ClpC